MLFEHKVFKIPDRRIFFALALMCASIMAYATRLGIPRTTLNAMMKKLGISRKDL